MDADIYYVPPEHWSHCLFSVDSLLLAEFDTFEFERESSDDDEEDPRRCVVVLYGGPVLINDTWHDELPLHLTVTGQIQAQTSLLRCRRRFNPGPNVTATTAVFNIEPRADPVSQTLWERTLESLRRVAELAGEDGSRVDLSQLLVEVGETTVIRVSGQHICHTGESVCSLLSISCRVLILSSGTTRVSDAYHARR